METTGKRKKQVYGCLQIGLEGGKDCKGALRKVWGMMKLLFILIMKMFSLVYKHVKMDHIVFKYRQFYTSIMM